MENKKILGFLILGLVIVLILFGIGYYFLFSVLSKAPSPSNQGGAIPAPSNQGGAIPVLTP